MQHGGDRGDRLTDQFRPDLDRPRRTLICFSHLRWEFVFQRPQHLMTRFARNYHVLYWEESRLGEEAEPRLEIRPCPASGVVVVTPILPDGLDVAATRPALRTLLDGLVADTPGEILRWYYTPMMLPFSDHVRAACTVYDCMDELTGFRFAPKELSELESALIKASDVVFTGGYSLYEAKRDRHRNIHPFPSSVDRAHFGRARSPIDAPADQRDLPRPRFGFYGVVDERMDLDLLAAVADARPDWSIIMVGPVVKIDPASLPHRPNLHYLGGKSYAELPAYLAGWDVALMPFAINESTRFISPTKTPEYLAGGKPIVSTPITDVARHYGELPAVRIAADADQFVRECDAALEMAKTPEAWLPQVDATLADLSWDTTFKRMAALVSQATEGHKAPAIRPASRRKRFDYLVVGAGFAGSVMAERLAAGSGKKVLLIDRRPHIAGNAYDHLDAAGILIHQYGPHIFHTNSQEIADYLSRFTSWRPYEHRVLASVDG